MVMAHQDHSPSSDDPKKSQLEKTRKHKKAKEKNVERRTSRNDQTESQRTAFPLFNPTTENSSKPLQRATTQQQQQQQQQTNSTPFQSYQTQPFSAQGRTSSTEEGRMVMGIDVRMNNSLWPFRPQTTTVRPQHESSSMKEKTVGETPPLLALSGTELNGKKTSMIENESRKRKAPVHEDLCSRLQSFFHFFCFLLIPISQFIQIK